MRLFDFHSLDFKSNLFRPILLTSTKLVTKGFIKLIVGFNKSISEQNKDIQAKKNTPNPISIKVFSEFQAIIKRISEQTKKPQAIACGERTF